MSSSTSISPSQFARNWNRPEWVLLARTIVVAIGTAAMLEASRVFLSTMIFVVDQSQREEIAANVAVVYLLGALGVLLVRFLGSQQSVVVAGVILIAFRIGLQFTDDPTTRYRIAAGVMAAWAWLIFAVLTQSRSVAAKGIALGFALDVAIRFGTATLGLAWMSTSIRDAVLLLAMAVLAAAIAWTRIGELPPARQVSYGSLVAIGGAVGLFQVATGNLGLSVVNGDLPPTMMPWLLVFGTLIAIAWKPPRPTLGTGTDGIGIGFVVGLTLLAALSLALFMRWDGIVDIAIGLTAATATALLLIAVGTEGMPTPRFDLWKTELWLTVGLLLQAVILFAYFSATGAIWYAGLLLVVLAIGALLAVRTGDRPPRFSPQDRMAVVVTSLACLVALIVGSPKWSEPAAGASVPRELTVISYNIQSGFSVDNFFDLERTAKVIEAQQPDVVILQEVSRGWTVTTGVDQLNWLSQRLDMPFVWGPSSADRLWGLAVLSKAPMHDADMTRYSVTNNLERGVLSVRVETEVGDLWVYATHLDNGSEAAEVRITQTQELLAVWDGKTPAVVAGDFNASPESDVVRLMTDAGFVDAAAILGPDVDTSGSGVRIDYVFASAGMSVVSASVPQEWASDHLPVVTTLTID